MAHKGFTMIEALIVLSLVSFLLLFSMSHSPQDTLIKKEILMVKEWIELTRRESLSNVEGFKINFMKNQVNINHHSYYLSHCTSEDKIIQWNQLSHIQHADTVHFHCGEIDYSLIFHLGSGHVEIK